MKYALILFFLVISSVRATDLPELGPLPKTSSAPADFLAAGEFNRAEMEAAADLYSLLRLASNVSADEIHQRCAVIREYLTRFGSRFEEPLPVVKNVAEMTPLEIIDAVERILTMHDGAVRKVYDQIYVMLTEVQHIWTGGKRLGILLTYLFSGYLDWLPTQEVVISEGIAKISHDVLVDRFRSYYARQADESSDYDGARIVLKTKRRDVTRIVNPKDIKRKAGAGTQARSNGRLIKGALVVSCVFSLASMVFGSVNYFASKSRNEDKFKEEITVPVKVKSAIEEGRSNPPEEVAPSPTVTKEEEALNEIGRGGRFNPTKP